MDILHSLRGLHKFEIDHINAVELMATEIGVWTYCSNKHYSQIRVMYDNITTIISYYMVTTKTANHPKPLETIPNHSKPSETIQNHPKPPETIQNHPKPPKISCNQPETTWN